MIKKRIFRLFSAVLFPALALSCSYKPELRGVNTEFDISFLEIKGTQATIGISPHDDICWYELEVLPVAEFDAAVVEAGGEQPFMQKTLDQSYDWSEEKLNEFRKNGDKYICSFDDIALHFGNRVYYYIELAPLTDYYVLVFCVDPVRIVPSGPLIRKKFTTTDISPLKSEMELSFLLQDTEEAFYYYTKPVIQGKLCRDPYLVDIVPDDSLARFGGSIKDYALAWYADKVEKGTVRSYLKTDISRCEAILNKTDEGKGFNIIGAAYNLNNIQTLFSLHFVYKCGMITDGYANDQE